jgi:cytochrome c-type biogenesis protein CcmH
LLQDQPELLQSLDNLLARAREKASGNAVAETSVSNSQGTPAATETKAVTLNVSLDETIADKADPGDSVFVFAQAMNGPPMPLAVARLQVSELPVTVTLDDSMAMMPQMRLSAFDQVKVGARVSKSGQAMPQSGDLSGEVLNITPGQKDAVWVEINQVLP